MFIYTENIYIIYYVIYNIYIKIEHSFLEITFVLICFPNYIFNVFSGEGSVIFLYHMQVVWRLLGGWLTKYRTLTLMTRVHVWLVLCSKV